MTNVFVFGGIFTGSVSATILAKLQLSPETILLVGSLALVAGTTWALWLLPDALLRLGLILVTHSAYRLRILGRENVPQEGGVLLTPNHVSFVDALMLIASLDRPVRFIVEDTYFQFWMFKPFMKSLGAIPISSSSGPRMILRALRPGRDSIWMKVKWCVFSRRGRSPAPAPCYRSGGVWSALSGTGRPPLFPSIWTACGEVSSVMKESGFCPRFPENCPMA